MADTPTGETVVPSKNDGTPDVPAPAAPAPVEPPKEDPEVVKLRKELEQKTMRENQLVNQLKAKEEAEAAAEAKKLEENNQFKELYEQEKTKRETIESEKEEAERKATLNKVKSELLTDYSDEVKTVAEETGLTLVSDSEEDQKLYKEKLDKINTVVGTNKVTPNNPRPQNGEPELTGEDLRDVLTADKDGKEFEKIISKRPGIASMLGK